MSRTIFSMEISTEHELVMARNRAGQIAHFLGFNNIEQTHISAATSEIVRNALVYGGGGKIEYSLQETAPRMFMLLVSDQGPGMKNVSAILEKAYTPEDAKGIGIISSKRLMDFFQIESSPGRGTRVMLGKTLPEGAPQITKKLLNTIAVSLAHLASQDPLEVVRNQNRELIQTLEKLRQEREDLARLTRELEDTNRGVMALYAELDEKAEHLKKASEIKSRFLSHISHELRSPIYSIVSLSKILLDRVDGELSPEQEKQVSFIDQAADNLLIMVNDLLDLAKIEAGKITVHPEAFEVMDLFSALRGMMKPLKTSEAVELIFEDPRCIPSLHTDQGKVSQILRNFISNALKFTEKGEIRVSAKMDAQGKEVIFSVADTGIGIAEEDQGRIFEEFTQLENVLQKKIRGTGLGLPLSRKLAELLGGSVSLESKKGVGSTFSVTLPLVYMKESEEISAGEANNTSKKVMDKSPTPEKSAHRKILIIDDEEVDRYLLKGLIKDTEYDVIEAQSGPEGIDLIKKEPPHLIFLDLKMPGMSGFEVLEHLKSDPQARDIPVIIFTSKILSKEENIFLLQAAFAVFFKESPRQEIMAQIKEALTKLQSRMDHSIHKERVHHG